MSLHGRKMITTSASSIRIDNVVAVLNAANMTHDDNSRDIDYLWGYYRGIQPILKRTKEVRPEICNTIVENRAAEVVDFKSGYLVGEPIQYVSCVTEDSVNEDVIRLNQFMSIEEKASKDKELADWFHICGVAYRMVMPSPVYSADDEDGSPFEVYTLDPRSTFVVYSNDLRHEPVMGVTYVKDDDGVVHYSVYTRTEFFEIDDRGRIERHGSHILGAVPIFEYQLNLARMGSFEFVISILDAINTVESNRVDGIEQYIQALLLFHNVKIDEEKYRKLREDGAIMYQDIDPSLKAEIKYLNDSLDQSSTQELVNHMYETVLTICGMPNRNGGSSTSDTGAAVEMRDGWSAATTRAKDTEMQFCVPEKRFLRTVLRICKTMCGMSLSVRNLDIRFTRRNFENIYQKAQVLDMLLKNTKLAPRLAIEASGMFVDPEQAYAQSLEYIERAMRMEEEAAKPQKEETDDGESGSENDSGGTGSPRKGEDGGTED